MPADLLAPVGRALDGQQHAVLAVSGGLDSMCLLDVATRLANTGVGLTVATFDHRSGPHSARAVEHVRGAAGTYGLPVVVGTSAGSASSESEWRAARWSFLRGAAAARNAVVLTAHTADDHLETIVMRILRGAGARGLAGLLASSPGVERPFVRASRSRLAAHARASGLTWIDDPTNDSRDFFRNRVRLDLLPALRAAHPGLPAELLALGERAAELRAAIEVAVAPWVRSSGRRTVAVDPAVLALATVAERAIAWQAILGPAGIVLDRRGVDRLANLPAGMRTGYRLPLSGGFQVTRLRGQLLVELPESQPEGITLAAPGPARFGPWRFHLSAPVVADRAITPWAVSVEAGVALEVRGWRPGDRLRGENGAPGRRVSRFLADAGVEGPRRWGWPVVVARGEIIWVPGLGRAYAAPVRSGRPARRLVCERLSS